MCAKLLRPLTNSIEHSIRERHDSVSPSKSQGIVRRQSATLAKSTSGLYAFRPPFCFLRSRLHGLRPITNVNNHLVPLLQLLHVEVQQLPPSALASKAIAFSPKGGLTTSSNPRKPIRYHSSIETLKVLGLSASTGSSLQLLVVVQAEDLESRVEQRKHPPRDTSASIFHFLSNMPNVWFIVTSSMPREVAD